ncbi:hypothetical protein [Hymenobacter sp. 5516J-16]|uniref:hypothetical protein n=1 Tax=Hymenobacter sp. 5516J-16 TaxID=2932253 RepID=UPI00293F590B|nr:hypothetical protein [Hymenobacter sp. 5516J-16]
MSAQDLLKTEEAISFVKESFAKELSAQLQLSKVSSPIAVLDGTGINDDLNGIERPVGFPIKALDERRAVVVHSLAKWKRVRLQELGIESGRGLLTDMRALRPDEDYSPIHSIYVDQWDWEKHISPEQRTPAFLKATVERIYEALKTTEAHVAAEYPKITPVLPGKITFLHAEDLLRQYPTLTPKQRENEVVKQYGAVFLMGIGHELSHGEPHDGRAPTTTTGAPKPKKATAASTATSCSGTPSCKRPLRYHQWGFGWISTRWCGNWPCAAVRTGRSWPFMRGC